MTPFVPIDDPIRQRAIRETGFVLTVEAGAGTGKTRLLTDRFVHLVESGAASPSRIVAITFTEKAAAELRSRIRKALEVRGLGEALDELERAPISTIHSFAGSILRERPFEAGIDPDFEQLDEMGKDLFLRSAYDRWLSAALSAGPGTDSSPLTRGLAAGIALGKIQELAFSLYAQRDLLSSLPVPPPAADLEGFFSDALEEADLLWSLASKACVQTADEGYLAIEELHRELDTVRNAPLRTRERAVLLRLSSPSTKGNKSNWADPKLLAEIKERMKILGDRLKTVRKSLRSEIFSELTLWLRTFATYADEEKVRGGKLDFDDLLIRARDLLRNRPDVRDYFRGRYSFLLVDEFQDTDPVQAELIWLLASKSRSDAPAWRDLDLEPGKLFIVGDPKQSIYRFRRASIEIYQAAAAEMTKRGEALVIRQNFRSSPPLIRWGNLVFPGILREAYTPLSADDRHLWREDRKPVVLLAPPLNEPSGNAPSARRMEAEAIAAAIRRMLDDGLPRVFDASTEGLRPARPGDFALLFPTTTDLDLFEEELRRYDLPFSLEGGHLFYHRMEIHAALACLDAVAHATDPIAVVAALRSSLLGLSDSDLQTMIERKIPFDYRSLPDDALPEPLRAPLEILRDLHGRIHLPPSRILSDLLERTAAIPLTLTRRHGEQAAANLRKLVSIARNHERAENTDLDRFVAWARERSEEAERQAESPLAKEEDDRIRLMTIHKAKGLEFPIVVLANLSVKAEKHEPVLADRFHGTLSIGIGPKDARFSTTGYEELAAVEKGRREEEKRRLLYVAATRAKDLLILPKFLPERNTAGSLWSILDDGWEKGKELIETVPFESLTLRARATGEPPGGITPDRTLKDASEVLLERFARRSASWVRGLPIRTATGDLRHDRKTAPVSSSDAAAAAVGSAFHKVMERIDFRKGPEQLGPLCERIAQEVGVPGAAGEVAALAATTFSAPWFVALARARSFHRELPFSWKRNGELFEGVIDLVIEDEEGLVLIDYKTDRVTEVTAEERATNHFPQIRLYAEALGAITGRPVREALLFFVRIGRTVPAPLPNRRPR